MNVSYEDLSTSDVAKMLKLNITTVTTWCRDGRINCQDVSESGANKARYLIPEYEADYLRKLYKKWGKHKAMRHYEKDRLNAGEKEMKDMPWLLDLDVEEAKEESVKESNEVKQVDDDKLLNSIIYICEVKERINDCKAELNQLENEYRELREEIIGWL